MRENLKMHLDPFSDLLRLLEARSIISGALLTGGRWAIRFPAGDKIKFWGVVRGTCWLQIDGASAPLAVTAGDVFLLRAPSAHVLASEPGVPPVALERILDERQGTLARHGAHDDFLMIGGKVELASDSASILLDELPPLIRVPAGARHAASLGWLLQQLVEERADPQPGAGAASAQLAHLMFIQILRAHFDDAGALPSGRLRALGDRRLAPALQLMHAAPGRNWQLAELAQAAAMSRASFCAYFKAVAGLPPLAYLTEWRMRLAEQTLRKGPRPLGALAASLGYTSESAFSNAFKRVTGCAPSHYQRAQQAKSVTL